MEIFTVDGSRKVEWSDNVKMAMNESAAWFQARIMAIVHIV